VIVSVLTFEKVITFPLTNYETLGKKYYNYYAFYDPAEMEIVNIVTRDDIIICINPIVYIYIYIILHATLSNVILCIIIITYRHHEFN